MHLDMLAFAFTLKPLPKGGNGGQVWMDDECIGHFEEDDDAFWASGPGNVLGHFDSLKRTVEFLYQKHKERVMFSKRNLERLADALERGVMSVCYVAALFGFTIEDLEELFASHGISYRAPI